MYKYLHGHCCVLSDWNSWMLGESLSLERSYNLEPDTVLGTAYLDLFRKLVTMWRAGTA